MVSVCTTFTDRKYREVRESTGYRFTLHFLNHYVVDTFPVFIGRLYSSFRHSLFIAFVSFH